MYLDHEGIRIGDTSPTWRQQNDHKTREAHMHFRGAAHAKVPGV